MLKSFAYLSDVTGFDEGDDNLSLDLLSTPVREVHLEHKAHLKRFRASFCSELTSAVFKDCPELEVVDVLNCKFLSTLQFVNCPNLRALECSGCTKLKKVPGIESLEYLSMFNAGFVIKSMPKMPNLKFLDYSPRDDDDKCDLSKFPTLEVLRFACQRTLITTASISKHPTLRVLNLQFCAIVCDSIHPSTHLQVVSMHDMRSRTGDFGIFAKHGIFVGMDPNAFNEVPYRPELMSNLQFTRSAKLVYGPWGVPNVDAEPVPTVSARVQPPANCDIAAAVDGIAGSLFASAICDMIGVGTEFVVKSQALTWLPEPCSMLWSHSRTWEHNMRFLRGTPTDDTSQMLLIMRSIVSSNHWDEGHEIAADGTAVFETHGVFANVADFGIRLLTWAMTGHAEHNHPGGLGIGSTTLATLRHPAFQEDPIQAAAQVWESSGRKVAPNGSVMRIASSGCFAFWDEEVVKMISDKYGRSTHADPRCVYCAIGAALIISRLLQQRSGLRADFDLDATLEEVYALVPESETHRDVIHHHCHVSTVEELELSGNRAIGYCLKAFGSAVWALRYCDSFEEGLAKVVREAGDADTNGAVVGALLGAKFGFAAIPSDFLECMFVGQWMWREVKMFMNTMGLEPPPSPWKAE